MIKCFSGLFFYLLSIPQLKLWKTALPCILPTEILVEDVGCLNPRMQMWSTHRASDVPKGYFFIPFFWALLVNIKKLFQAPVFCFILLPPLKKPPRSPEEKKQQLGQQMTSEQFSPGTGNSYCFFINSWFYKPTRPFFNALLSFWLPLKRKQSTFTPHICLISK